VVERAIEPVVLFFAMEARDFRWHRRLIEDARKVQAARLPVIDAGAGVEQIRAADQLLEAADAELRHDAPHFVGDEEHEIDDVLGLAIEFRAQQRVLRRDADRAGIEMALAHHDASGGDQRRRREAELVGAEKRPHDDVAAGFHLAVDLNGDAAAQAVEHQRLLASRLSPAPTACRRALDRRLGRRAGTAVVAGDRHMIGRLGQPRPRRRCRRRLRTPA
jgi:hypothetical protein